MLLRSPTGWNQLLRTVGNCAAIAESSFDVPDGVPNGQYGVGLVVDFFGLAPKNSGFPVEFVFTSVTAIVPANIAIFNSAKKHNGRRKMAQKVKADYAKATELANNAK